MQTLLKPAHVTGLSIAVFALGLSTESVAQELTNCLVGSMPCVDVRTFQELLRKCVPNPSLCEIGPDRRATNPAHATTPSAVNPSPDTAKLASDRPASGRPASIRPAFVPNEPRRPVVIRNDIAAAPEQRAAVDIADAESLGTSIHAIIDLSDRLPLDPATRDLADAAPDDPTVVERMLGLRPSRVAGEDLRGRTPSIQDFVRALSPAGAPP